MEYELGWMDAGDLPDDVPSEETGPVLPEGMVEEPSGEWRRRLVLPNQDGELRVLPVARARKQSA